MAKLLLVEDDNNLREIYEARLQAEGYEIIAARDGEEALVVAKAQKPDLIISDVMMPKISGFEMLDILRNTDGLKDVKVIMLTALGQNEDQKRADHLGADRYLVKSQVTLEDIVKVAHSLLGDEPAAETPGNSPAAATPAPPTVAPPITAPIATPVAEPVTPPPAPAPVAVAPAPEPNQDASVAAAQPQTEAKETEEVETRIEDFVSGATDEAPAPIQSTPVVADTQATPVAEPVTPPPAPAPVAVAPAPTAPVATPAPVPSPAPAPVVSAPRPTTVPAPAPAPPVASAPNPAPAAPAPAPAPASEGVVNNSAQRLEEKPQEPDEDTPAGQPTVIGAPAEQASTNESSENVPIAHKKVIAPLESSPKKDVSTLLAEEQAKAAAQTPAGSVPPSTTSGLDPNIAAL